MAPETWGEFLAILQTLGVEIEAQNEYPVGRGRRVSVIKLVRTAEAGQVYRAFAPAVPMATGIEVDEIVTVAELLHLDLKLVGVLRM